MSGKGKVVPSKQVTTTPRRLRSGTHYGDHKSHIQVPLKKENKKTTKEPNDAYDSDNNSSKGTFTKASKNHSIVYGEKHRHRSTSHSSSVSPTSGSPNQHQKGQTLKAILESIEPNLCLKSKPSKRKSLRDLLDQKLSKDKAGSERKDGCREHRRQFIKSEKHVMNGENHNHSKNYPRDSAKDNRYDFKTEPGTATTQNTMHTQTPAQVSNLPKIKEELPDDYWAMNRNYSDKNSTKNSSVEFRIKAGHPTHFDDRSQTFRISCSRPEILDTSPTALPRNMKPDIVLKVRPRSSSLSALGRSAPDTKWMPGTVKNMGRYHGRLESHSRLYSKVSPLPFRSPYDLESAPARDMKQLYRSASSTLHSHDVVLNDSSTDLKSHGNVMKSLDLYELEQQDVLEESKLPPVARTVELLSEPHDYYYDNDDVRVRLTDRSKAPRSRHISDCGDLSRRIVERSRPMTCTKTELLNNDGKYHRKSERKSLDSKDKDPRLWGKYGSANTGSEKVSPSEIRMRAGSSPAVNDFNNGQTEETEEEQEEDEEVGWTDSGDKVTVRNHSLKTRAEQSRNVREANVAVACIPDKHGPRRRRKGRPSRRAKTERRWQTSDLCLSPREEEEGEEAEEEGGDPAVVTDKVCMDKSASRSASSSLDNARKGCSKRGSDTGGGARRGRKAVDLETLWANPELDTHAFLLWASENRSEVEKQKPEVGQGEVEDVLARQWRQLPFSAKMQYLCRARDASTDHNKHTVRKKKVATEKKESSSPSDGRSVYEEFLRLPQERQKDLLRKWLRFFQKMLPRLEYQDFISDFKKACKSLSLRPVPARRKNARLRNLDPSHYHMLFEKIRETRPRVISVYNKRKAREEQLLSQSFNAMVRRLILGQPWPFVRGCRSKILGELLKDIQQLEVEEVLAQIDFPLSLTPADLADPFLTSKDLHDPAVLCPADVVTDSGPADPAHCPTGPHTTAKEGHPRKGSGCSSASTALPTVTMAGGSAGDAELPDSPFVLSVLDGLRHAVDLPVLDQRSLDSVFLAPPTRSRSQNQRDTQFQNSATYRRTLLYKHIQPLLDARGMPLPSSALYHSHSAQYFYADER